ncbi:hypothetical protein MGYG_04387 [Nannizzia gypsea CBS 118893]|uniref:Uncharacterized protein n=1 Tax=Arthroderma gypseum (strain ATCC MYA-4604 / CBS 118893) TaxID=535722 RepID=E4USM9_ARTGP|nr:hypothetical protein MGYG_04387 [Nannizzia gypsea CBS 118893]EFR01380.1 hypothetical protein MGYG_04387 [Nannizzia gypsea CBS 118893]
MPVVAQIAVYHPRQRRESTRSSSPFDPYHGNQTGPDIKGKRKALGSPDYSSPQQSDSRQPNESDYLQHSRDVSPHGSRDQYMQSPTPAPRSDKGSTYPSPSPHQLDQQTSRDLPYRPSGDTHQSRSGSPRGSKPGTSNDPPRNLPGRSNKQLKITANKPMLSLFSASETHER